MDATESKCACGGEYVIQCADCGDYPSGIEPLPVGTLDVLRGLMDTRDPRRAGLAERDAAIDAGRRILEKA